MQSIPKYPDTIQICYEVKGARDSLHISDPGNVKALRWGFEGLGVLKRKEKDILQLFSFFFLGKLWQLQVLESSSFLPECEKTSKAWDWDGANQLLAVSQQLCLEELQRGLCECVFVCCQSEERQLLISSPTVDLGGSCFSHTIPAFPLKEQTPLSSIFKH